MSECSVQWTVERSKRPQYKRQERCLSYRAVSKQPVYWSYVWPGNIQNICAIRNISSLPTPLYILPVKCSGQSKRGLENLQEQSRTSATIVEIEILTQLELLQRGNVSHFSWNVDDAHSDRLSSIFLWYLVMSHVYTLSLDIYTNKSPMRMEILAWVMLGSLFTGRIRLDNWTK